MRPESGLPLYPDQRLIVFAGVNNQEAKLLAVERRKPEAIMASFELIKPGKKGIPRDGGEYFTRLASWPHYRYLDSGVFSIVSRSGKVRNKSGTQATLEARALKGESGKVAYAQDAFDHLNLYIDYLERRLHEWDWVFDCDLDPVSLIMPSGSEAPGYEFTWQARERLRSVAGDRLIPVWHSVSDTPGTFPKLHALLNSGYRYIAIGSSVLLSDRQLRHVCDIAHQHGVLVHGLGTSKADVLEVTPFDTVDSSTWLSGGKFGQYGGIVYTNRRDMSPKEQARARNFEELVRGLGYDPADLLKKVPDAAMQHTIAIAVLQERQKKANAVSHDILHQPSLPLELE